MPHYEGFQDRTWWEAPSGMVLQEADQTASSSVSLAPLCTLGSCNSHEMHISYSVDPRWSLSLCPSNKLPGDAEGAAGTQTTL